MKGITNPAFWKLWKQRKYREALRAPIHPAKPTGEGNRLQSFLFGNAEELKQTMSTGAIMSGEFLYDYFRLDPTVMEGIDFARAEDLSSLFTFSTFAGKIETSVNTGDIAQMQGYVAERMIAAELQAKGHDVEFPETSNQAGYDLLVEGNPFQVKNLLDPAGVREHLEKYPDIPVYVNAELAGRFENNPMVYATQVQHAEVVQATKDTIIAGADLTDLELPYITLFVSTITQTKKLIFDDVSLGQAVFNVFSDTSSRVVLGTIGQYAGSAAGLLLFGPAGAFVGTGVGAMLGAGQGGRLSAKLKSLIAGDEEKALFVSIADLIQRVNERIDRKLELKLEKHNAMLSRLGSSEAERALTEEIKRLHETEVAYAGNKRKELQAMLEGMHKGKQTVLEATRPLLEKIAQSGVHPHHYQRELGTLTKHLNAYMKRLK